MKPKKNAREAYEKQVLSDFVDVLNESCKERGKKIEAFLAKYENDEELHDLLWSAFELKMMVLAGYI